MAGNFPFSLEDEFYCKHSALLCDSYEHLIGKPLVKSGSNGLLQVLFEAPFALVSHGTEENPIFNFANRTALHLFAMSWDEFTSLPSKESAEPINREERQSLLEQVLHRGFIEDYSGIRISSTGRRFFIENATVWVLNDSLGNFRGQAAVFDKWTFL